MKSTKKALLTSALSLLLCVSMLVGTTFAWFTDSVTSGVNQIIAGNLDVEVTHSNAKVTDANVEGEQHMFTDANGNPMLWEPGAVSYETFSVKNVGTLAFKYNMSMNIIGFNAVDGHTLKEVLKVKVLTGEDIQENVTRASVIAMNWDTTDSLDAFKMNGGKLYPNPTDGKDSEDKFQVVVYWQPGDNDNLWNVNNGKTTTDGQPLFINFGVNLIAAQLEHESDSFDHLYDEDAEFASSGSASATVEDGKAAIFHVNVAPQQMNAPVTTIEFEDGALPEGEYHLDVETINKLFSISSENGEAALLNLSLFDQDNELTSSFAEGKYATITTYISKGLEGVSVLYGNDGIEYLQSYDPATGKLVFKTNHFSEYIATHDSTAYSRRNDTAYTTVAAALDAAADKDTVVLLKNVAECITVAAGKDVTIDLAGMTISGKTDNTITVDLGGTLVVKDSSGNKGIVESDVAGSAHHAILNNGTATINGGTYCNTDKNEQSDYIILNHGVMTINDAIVSDTYCSAVVNGYYYPAGDSEWNGSPENGYVENVNQEHPQLTINGGSFTGGLAAVKTDFEAKSIINNGIFENTITNQASCLKVNGTVIVNNGTFKSEYAALDVSGDSATINGGTFDGGIAAVAVFADDSIVEINNGSFNSNYYSVYEVTGKLTINGGSFTSETIPVYCNNAELIVTGGYYKGASNRYNITLGKDYSIEIKGGYYATKNVTNGTLASGYVRADNTDSETKGTYPYTIERAAESVD